MGAAPFCINEMKVHPPEVLWNERNNEHGTPATAQLAGVTTVPVYVLVASSHFELEMVSGFANCTSGSPPQMAENAIRALATGSQSITTPKSSTVGQPVVSDTVQFSSHGVPGGARRCCVRCVCETKQTGGDETGYAMTHLLILVMVMRWEWGRSRHWNTVTHPPPPAQITPYHHARPRLVVGEEEKKKTKQKKKKKQ
jgi:hypothetical protein